MKKIFLFGDFCFYYLAAATATAAAGFVFSLNSLGVWGFRSNSRKKKKGRYRASKLGNSIFVIIVIVFVIVSVIIIVVFVIVVIFTVVFVVMHACIQLVNTAYRFPSSSFVFLLLTVYTINTAFSTYKKFVINTVLLLTACYEEGFVNTTYLYLSVPTLMFLYYCVLLILFIYYYCYEGYYCEGYCEGYC